MNPPARPPVIVLGGAANALSIARSLGSLGVRVHGIDVAEAVTHSRFLTPIPVGGTDREAAVAEFLLGPESDHLRGAVLLAGGDVGITVLARHRERLAERFRLVDSDVRAQLGMLDKLTTYEWARDAGVPTPRFWRAEGPADLESAREEFCYPLLVKPILSHRYQARFAESKFRVAHDFDELCALHRTVTAAGLAVMLVEQVPGPDSLLCSYYTFIDETGNATFDFTKRIVRRYPPGMGLACYHVTDRNPAVREVALRLFKHAGLRGLANAEFKLDERDGQLKLIECNARFTDANPLVAAAGLDLARYVYLRVIGEPYDLPDRYRTGLHMIYLSNDARSFRELRARGELTVGRWLRSLAHRQTFPYLRWDDPGPVLALSRTRWALWAGRLGGRTTTRGARGATARPRRRG